MPPFPGEERLLTLFTDCHYYFAQPTARPLLHRFDKASYFYIYYNNTRHTSRIEVANNPGTPDQDAFSGQLDTCRVINSHKFPTLVTLVVDAIDTAPSPTSSRAGRDPDEWRLQSADPRDSDKSTKYRLHTIDFYFWTQEDARLVVQFFSKLLNAAQLDIVEARSSSPPLQQQQQQQQEQQQRPPLQSNDTGTSPVVRNLEKVAISDPAYSNGQTRNSQNQPQSQAILLPPPPPPSTSQQRTVSRSTASPSATSPSPVSQLSQADSRRSPQTEKSTLDFTPMAYNPAAPAAPEKIAHREKTPPPEDGAQGTGLSAAALHDDVSVSATSRAQSQPWNSSQASQPSHWGSPPPPAASHVSQSGHWGSPPAPSATSGYGSPPLSSAGYPSAAPTPQYHQGRSSVASVTTASPFAPPPGSYTPSQTASSVPSFAPPPTNPTPSQDPHRHSTAAETYTPGQRSEHYQAQPVETPGTQFYNTIHQPNRPLQHVQPQYADYLTAGGSKPGHQPPPGGYSEYSYSQGSQSSQGNNPEAYEIHNQVYRPTEAEASSHSRHKPKKGIDAKFEPADKKAQKLKDKFMKRFG